MNTARLMQMSEELNDTGRLVREAEELVRARDRQRQLALLACVEKRLETLERQVLEAALSEALWRYMEFVEGTDEGYVVRQVIADMAARTALSDER